MPALPSPGAVLKLQLRWTVDEETNAMNVLHYRYSGTRPNATALNAIAQHALDTAPAGFLVLVTASTSLTQAIVTDLQGNDGQQGTFTATHPGTDPVGQRVAGQVCFLQNLHIQARYRGGHPRIYWPGMTTAHLNTSQHWVTSAVTSANNALQTWLIGMTGFSSGGTTVGNHCVVSYYKDKAIRPTPLVLDVQSYAGNPLVATQRRRLHV